jgi:hypothetical protein
MELVVLALLRASDYVLIAVGFALVFGSLRENPAVRKLVTYSQACCR